MSGVRYIANERLNLGDRIAEPGEDVTDVVDGWSENAIRSNINCDRIRRYLPESEAPKARRKAAGGRKGARKRTKRAKR